MENETKQMLLNNGYDWYVVTLEDGTTDLRHESQLSAILQCGHKPERYGIVEIQQCWNGQDLDK